MTGEQLKSFYPFRLSNGGLNSPQFRPETLVGRPEMGMIPPPDREIAIRAAQRSLSLAA